MVLRDPELIARELQTKTLRRPVNGPSAIAALPLDQDESEPTILDQVTKAKEQAESKAILAALNSTHWNRKQAIEDKVLSFPAKSNTPADVSELKVRTAGNYGNDQCPYIHITGTAPCCEKHPRHSCLQANSGILFLRVHAFTASLLRVTGVTIARADSTLPDTFAQSQAGCTYSTSAPYSTCDVIGAPNATQASMFLNYGGGSSLSPFFDVTNLSVGDLFFYSPSNPDRYLYGVPLHSHGQFTAGDVYQIGGNATTRTAQDVLQNTTASYRRSESVWLGASGPVTPAQTGGTVTTTSYEDGVTNALYDAMVRFTNPSGFYQSLVSNSQVGIAFSSATCGNDVIKGSVAVNPEPGSVILLMTCCLFLLAAKFRAPLFSCLGRR